MSTPWWPAWPRLQHGQANWWNGYLHCVGNYIGITFGVQEEVTSVAFSGHDGHDYSLPVERIQAMLLKEKVECQQDWEGGLLALAIASTSTATHGTHSDSLRGDEQQQPLLNPSQQEGYASISHSAIWGAAEWLILAYPSCWDGFKSGCCCSSRSHQVQERPSLPPKIQDPSWLLHPCLWPNLFTRFTVYWSILQWTVCRSYIFG